MCCIYTIGETVLDIAFKGLNPKFAIPGGSALNTAVSLGRFGNEIVFISELGDDIIGDETIRFLQTNSVNTNYITRYKDTKTSLALAFLDEENNANYSFYKYMPHCRKLVVEINFNVGDFVLFSSSFAVNADVRTQLLNILFNAKKNKTLIYYDPNIRFNSLDTNFQAKSKLVYENIALAHIVRGSDDDFKNILDTDSAEDAYRLLKQYGCRFFIYTKNSWGITVFIDDKQYFYKSISLVPVSTIGAGDTFNAGILYGLSKHEIYVDNLYSISEAVISDIVETSIAAASFVCMSEENYISTDFARSLLSRF